MPITFDGGQSCQLRITVTAANIVALGNVVEIQLLPNMRVTDIKAVKKTVFDTGTLKFNLDGGAGETVASVAELAITTASPDTVNCTAWMTSLNGLLATADRYIYWVYAGAAPASGSLDLIITYCPVGPDY